MGRKNGCYSGERKIMANPKSIEYGNQSSGIKITYVKSRDTLEFFGWFDHYVGIEGGEIKFKDFCKQLGIRKDNGV